ncbi:MAG: sigma-70 family RNA polymerase sigma factor [Lachnospiraceae bacterium]|nr:sigma-70 family RNA polymerase sigma factor [Lachnospiraceae bacterium]
MKESIHRFLLELSEEERNLFIGRYYFFDSLKRTAAYLGMSEAKAKSMLYRTRKRLKEYLVKEGYEG